MLSSESCVSGGNRRAGGGGGGGEAPRKAERTFFPNALQRWISRNPPCSNALHSVNTALSILCVHNTGPGVGSAPDPSTMKRHTALFFFFNKKIKEVLLNNSSRGLHSLLGPRTEVTEPSELAQCGNQNRRARLMPGGREEGWTNTRSP